MLNWEQMSLWMAMAIYALASVVVWIAGTRASRYTDAISRRTGIGGAVLGMILLGSITSLPEIGTSLTAAVQGNTGMAVGNLLGGVAFQIVVLAAVDMLVAKRALTGVAPQSSILLQAVACILLLAIAVAGGVAGDTQIAGFGIWSLALLLVYGLSLVLVRGQEKSARWVPSHRSNKASSVTVDNIDKPIDRRLIMATAVAALAILIAGYLLTRSAEAIATRTNVSLDVAGLTFLAVATSLPEFSTAISAVRIGRNDIAIGNVLGGNMFDLMLIFFVDLLFVGPPVLSEIGPMAAFAGLLGIILTAIYLVGMIERRDRTILRTGPDSLLVLLCYGGGLFLILRYGIG